MKVAARFPASQSRDGLSTRPALGQRGCCMLENVCFKNLFPSCSSWVGRRRESVLTCMQCYSCLPTFVGEFKPPTMSRGGDNVTMSLPSVGAPSWPHFVGHPVGAGAVSGSGSPRIRQGLSLSSHAKPPLAVNSHLYIIPEHITLCTHHLPRGRAGTSCPLPVAQPFVSPPCPFPPLIPSNHRVISSFTLLLPGRSPSSMVSCHDMLLIQPQPKNLVPFPNEHMGWREHHLYAASGSGPRESR